MAEDFWSGRYKVLLTSFWGWEPESWASVGFTKRGRRNTIVEDAEGEPFITLVYVTHQTRWGMPSLSRKLAGFYLTSLDKVHRNEVTHPRHHATQKNQWRYSLRATRAFSFLPEGTLHIDKFDPTVANRARSVAQYGEWLDEDRVRRLARLPFVESELFKKPGNTDTEDEEGGATSASANDGFVRAGTINLSGYFVEPSDPALERDLYVLRLRGSTAAFLDEPIRGASIYKIGLSVSPELRRATLQKSLPGRAFVWQIDRTTRGDGGSGYSYRAAEAGEYAMKAALASTAKHLSGEFYAASKSQLDAAWEAGRRRAEAFRDTEQSRQVP